MSSITNSIKIKQYCDIQNSFCILQLSWNCFCILNSYAFKMKINIQSDKELNSLLDALANEIVDANIYHRLFCDLVDSIDSHQRELSQSNTFWSLTLDALRDARLTRLCRVYDQESKSLNLVNLLDTIKANLHLFEEHYFRERLQDNAFVDSLAQTGRVHPSHNWTRTLNFRVAETLLLRSL